ASGRQPPASGRQPPARGRQSPASPRRPSRYSGGSDFTPVEPPPEAGLPLSGRPPGGGDNESGPFWLRPVRRRK
ncbi:MAG TPA: hypothetical protein VEV63_06000, partial [Streptosporangiaceae bacterium]|nr:hypothetical protein [Streptosporangiaceae bacterium]